MSAGAEVDGSPAARVAEAARVVLPRIERPRLGLVLGSGLGGLGARLEDVTAIPYEEVPHMPRPTVVGHGGVLLSGLLGGLPVVCLSGRAHLYEGHAPERVVFGARLLAALGAPAVLLTNAAGGIAADCAPGRLMLIEDHLNLTGQSPLVGPNDESSGPRFVDMTVAYDAELRALALRAAGALGLPLVRGVYAGLLGPSYETPAEIRMLERLGAAAVGMSTVLEVIALRHLGVRVLGLSCITNRAAGLGGTLLSHTEVAEVAGRAGEELCALVERLCAELAAPGVFA